MRTFTPAARPSVNLMRALSPPALVLSPRTGRALTPLSPFLSYQKILCALFWILTLAAIAALAVFATPPLTKHVIIPVLRYLSSKLNTPALIAVCAAMIIFLPLAFVPWRAAVWLSAFRLGAGWGFLLATVASAVGMAIPFLLARYGGLHDRVLRWAGKKEWYRTMVLAVEDVGPAKTVVAMRLGPAPYALFNYVAALVPSIPFWRYLAASIVGHIPDTCIHLSIGAAAKGLSAAIEGKGSPPKAATYVRYLLPIAAAIAIAVAGTIYCRRALARVRAAAVEEPVEVDSDDDGSEEEGAAAVAPAAAQGMEDVELGATAGRASGRVAPARGGT